MWPFSLLTSTPNASAPPKNEDTSEAWENVIPAADKEKTENAAGYDIASASIDMPSPKPNATHLTTEKQPANSSAPSTDNKYLTEKQHANSSTSFTDNKSKSEEILDHAVVAYQEITPDVGKLRAILDHAVVAYQKALDCATNYQKLVNMQQLHDLFEPAKITRTYYRSMKWAPLEVMTHHAVFHSQAPIPCVQPATNIFHVMDFVDVETNVSEWESGWIVHINTKSDHINGPIYCVMRFPTHSTLCTFAHNIRPHAKNNDNKPSAEWMNEACKNYSSKYVYPTLAKSLAQWLAALYELNDMQASVSLLLQFMGSKLQPGNHIWHNCSGSASKFSKFKILASHPSLTNDNFNYYIQSQSADNNTEAFVTKLCWNKTEDGLNLIAVPFASEYFNDPTIDDRTTLYAFFHIIRLNKENQNEIVVF